MMYWLKRDAAVHRGTRGKNFYKPCPIRYNRRVKEIRRQSIELQDLKSDLGTLLDSLPGMVYRCLHDDQHTLLFASAGCLELTGYAPDDLVDNQIVKFVELIHPEDTEVLFQEISAAVEEKRPFRCTYRLTTAAGEERWVLDKGEAVITPDGTIAALEGFIIDHTERMTAFQLLEQRVIDRTRKLSALYDILEVASDPGDLQTTITRSLHRVLKAIDGNAGAIHLLDSTGDTLHLTAQQGLSETAAARLTQIDVQGSRLAGWVVRHNEPLFISKMSEDDRAANLIDGSDLDVYIAVPIVANDQVRGVLTVLGDTPSRYTAVEEMELLSSVGEQLGVVVENARLRQQAEQLMVLEERNRLARELHDSVTQSLYSVTLFAEAGSNLTEVGEYERAGQLFKDVLETGQQALKEMRLLVHKLRPSLLEKEGLIRALQHRLNAVEGRAGVKNQLIVEGKPVMKAEVEEAFYHVAQEALNNAIKHAIAGEVRIYLRQVEDDSVELVVTDNGKGFDPETAAEGGGLGLTSMRERIENLGGDLTIQSSIAQGTKVQARLPVSGNR
jgi:PAS domain S-box-containing protein